LQFQKFNIKVLDGDGEFADVQETVAILDMYRVESVYQAIDSNCPIVTTYSGDKYAICFDFDQFESLLLECMNNRLIYLTQ